MQQTFRLDRAIACGLFFATSLIALGCSETKQPQAVTQPTPHAAESAIPNVDLQIELTGEGLTAPRTYTFAELAKMKMTSLDDVLMQRSHDPDINTNWRGTSLAELLAACGLKPGPMIITMEASDGYTKKIGLDMLESALIALQDGDGKWLAESQPDNPVRLVAPKATANYWVANIRRITVSPRAE